MVLKGFSNSPSDWDAFEAELKDKLERNPEFAIFDMSMSGYQNLIIEIGREGVHCENTLAIDPLQGIFYKFSQKRICL